MRYETLHQVQIPKVGFGTATIGSQDLQALRSALQLGYTHFDTAEVYTGGQSEEVLGRAIREEGIPRERLFITSKVSPDHLRYDEARSACLGSLRRLGMDYLDLYLIHWPKVGMKLEETFRALNELVRDGLVRHLGVSNFHLKQLQQSAALCETPLLTNQVSYSIPDRTYEKNGVLAYCQQNDILLTAYTPIKRRNIKSNPVLKAIAQARGLTPPQVALAWVVTQPRVITIPQSTNPQHQADNLRAADIMLTPDEMEQLAWPPD